MRVGYVDTSILLAVIFRERQGAAALRRLRAFDVLAAADLLHAELQATFHREKLDQEPTLPVPVSLIIPDRSLQDEIRRVLAAGSLRGADCWHLATALYLAPDPTEITFPTLNTHQAAVAHKLGFRK